MKGRERGIKRTAAATVGTAVIALFLVGLVGCGNHDGSTDQSRAPGESTRTAATPSTPSAAAGGNRVVETGGPAGKTSSGAVMATKTAVQDTEAAPATGPVTYGEAEAAFKSKRYGEAVTLFARYRDDHPGNPWGHYMLGLASWKAGRLEEAEAAFGQALELDPSHVKSLLNGARVFLEEEKPGEALQYVQKAIDLDPDLGEAHRMMGRCLVELGKSAEGEEAYQRAIVLDGRDAWAMNNLGLILIREGRFEDALPVFARAVELRGDVAVMQNNLGVVLERLGNEVAAAEAYRTAVSLDDGYAKARESLARVERHESVGGEPAVDLAAASEIFQRRIEEWRAGTESGAVEASALPAGPETVGPTEVTLGEGHDKP